jgi:hypothetical protein
VSKDTHIIHKRLLVWAGLLVVAIPLALLALSSAGFFPWSPINCTQIDIDLNSGRIRRTNYLLWMEVTTTVEDSALTKALSPQDRENLGEDWQPVSTFSPGLGHSPHYRFHGATSEIRNLEICWELGRMTPEARQQTARQVLLFFRQSGDYFGARRYIDAVGERALEAEKSGKSIDVGDLPVP